MKNKLTIAITPGDPYGIGPEVVVKSLKKFGSKINFVLIGPPEIYQSYGLKNNKHITFENIDYDFQFNKKLIGTIHKPAGMFSYLAFKKAIELAQQKQVSAIVTAPINKAAWSLAGIKEKGHTDVLDKIFKKFSPTMIFYSPKIIINLCTIHIPLSKVTKSINPEILTNTIKNTHDFLIKLGKKKPKISIAGLNPHSGENGILGTEEKRIIIPTIKKLKNKYNLTGPIPADIIFHQGLSSKTLDAIVSIYHDQGLIPFKMVAFETGVNVSAGLPIIRTSVDHGTAFDIAGQNKANPQSMIEAIKLVLKLIPGG